MKKFYLAGPFFNLEERTIIDLVLEKIQETHSLDNVFVPMHYLISNGSNMSNDEWAEKVFQHDIKGLLQCDIIIAINHGHYSDTGTAWEIGYGYALRKACIILHAQNKVSSLMINQGCTKNIFLDDFFNQDLNEILRYLDSFNKNSKLTEQK